jgi:ribose transport system ATP-binding protein
VLARWLLRRPRILLLDEPTQRVDVGARQEIYAMLHRAAEAGTAAIVVSSDFGELARLCPGWPSSATAGSWRYWRRRRSTSTA